jgi:hypothetical protein
MEDVKASTGVSILLILAIVLWIMTLVVKPFDRSKAPDLPIVPVESIRN